MIRDSVIGRNCKLPELSIINLYECTVGDNCTIGAFVEIGRDVKIGNNCKIGAGAFIPQGVFIEDNVFIGPNVTFCNCKHPMTGEGYMTVMVRNGAVIGANSTILPGVTIERGAVVGAGSVVTKDIPMGETWAGNPAKLLL